MYPKRLKDLDVSIRARAAMERRIVRSLVRELLDRKGTDGTPLFDLAVNDGDEEYERTREEATLLGQLINTDEDRLYVYSRLTRKYAGGVLLVYGNDGWDVMCDWSISLDPYMPKTLKLVETLG